ncbi:GntR family transcriptional regulator [Phreatobacter aquaticus]|uniref:GntR family transcriptional regulator n=1 Tax=Phreatobacter aquaticus TaxID=2570229 RepID=A0A4D7QRC3_9HYPH|nr:GntR family transcriptional regulator [Phreatobacter aquaticus]QCK88136.1 GntR family transcriptional regulator [Phreatobacter aquaticus]
MVLAQAPSVDSRLPLYQQLREGFVATIAEGLWKPGDAIPAEDELAVRHGVAVGTVRKAIEGLVGEGLLERRQGRGTFVRRADFGSALARFFRMTDAAGQSIRPQARILARDILPADGETAERLGLMAGDPVIGLRRLRLADGVAILAEEIRLDHKAFGPLADLALTDFGDLLYPLYERICGRVVATARETIRFQPLSAPMAEALELPLDRAAVVIERVAFGFDGNPLEFRRSYGPADRFSYSIDIR